jgi:hypothetical protein
MPVVGVAKAPEPEQLRARAKDSSENTAERSRGVETLSGSLRYWRERFAIPLRSRLAATT